MADPAIHTTAQVRYEVRLVSGPLTIEVRGIEYSLEYGQDMPVLVRLTLMPGSRGDEKIIGVIGDRYRSGYSEFMNLIGFLDAGGVIGLHRDLQS